MLSSSASQLRVPLSCLQLPPLSALSTAPLAINSDQRVRSPTRRHASSTATTLTRWPKAQFPLVQFPAWGWGFTRSASSDATSTAAMDSTTQASPPPPAQLNWNDYLSLRRSRRRYNLVSSIATSICTTAAGMTAVQQNVEQINSLVGLDSITTLAISTLASAGVGWLSGPVLGTAVFNLTHKSVRGEMAAKEKDFYNRIKRHRVDPSRQSIQNPLPDYYGEKIGSVAEYRTWLKDQRAYNRKRQL